MSICTFPVLERNLYLPCVGTKSSKANGKHLFNATVYMEFSVCFTFVKYEKDRLSLC